MDCYRRLTMLVVISATNDVVLTDKEDHQPVSAKSMAWFVGHVGMSDTWANVVIRQNTIKVTTDRHVGCMSAPLTQPGKDGPCDTTLTSFFCLVLFHAAWLDSYRLAVHQSAASSAHSLFFPSVISDPMT